MTNVNVNSSNVIGKMKPMHCVNNGPIGAAKSQIRSNFEAYKALKIPYARNHDASFCSAYGGEHSVDVHMIFPDFSNDPDLPESYDFDYTDDYIKITLDAGTKTFYRLGSKIETLRKTYGERIPTDFKKWAVICEHIIAHYTEGWANGFYYDMPYWEIWNEPDGQGGSKGDIVFWQGTADRFYDFYCTVSKHLKKRFPNIKMGGPALENTKHTEWIDGFLSEVIRTGAPLDFFSWHVYSTDPAVVFQKAVTVREFLDKAGFSGAESILNEWNYVKDWREGFVDTILDIISIKGAAYSAAVMCTCQNAPVDMLMYYDFRPCAFNGAFDMYTLRPLKGYYAFKAFSSLYQCGKQVECSSDDSSVFALSAKGEGASYTEIVYYSDDDDAKGKEVLVSFESGEKSGKIYISDSENDMDKPIEFDEGTAVIKLKPNSICLIEAN